MSQCTAGVFLPPTVFRTFHVRCSKGSGAQYVRCTAGDRGCKEDATETCSVVWRRCNLQVHFHHAAPARFTTAGVCIEDECNAELRQGGYWAFLWFIRTFTRLHPVRFSVCSFPLFPTHPSSMHSYRFATSPPPLRYAVPSLLRMTARKKAKWCGVGCAPPYHVPTLHVRLLSSDACG